MDLAQEKRLVRNEKARRRCALDPKATTWILRIDPFKRKSVRETITFFTNKRVPWIWPPTELPPVWVLERVSRCKVSRPGTWSFKEKRNSLYLPEDVVKLILEHCNLSNFFAKESKHLLRMRGGWQSRDMNFDEWIKVKMVRQMTRSPLNVSMCWQRHPVARMLDPWPIGNVSSEGWFGVMRSLKHSCDYRIRICLGRFECWNWSKETLQQSGIITFIKDLMTCNVCSCDWCWDYFRPSLKNNYNCNIPTPAHIYEAIELCHYQFHFTDHDPLYELSHSLYSLIKTYQEALLPDLVHRNLSYWS
jgi:hypothetical protein